MKGLFFVVAMLTLLFPLCGCRNSKWDKGFVENPEIAGIKFRGPTSPEIVFMSEPMRLPDFSLPNGFYDAMSDDEKINYRRTLFARIMPKESEADLVLMGSTVVVGRKVDEEDPILFSTGVHRGAHVMVMNSWKSGTRKVKETREAGTSVGYGVGVNSGTPVPISIGASTNYATVEVDEDVFTTRVAYFRRLTDADRTACLTKSPAFAALDKARQAATASQGETLP